MAMVSDDRDRTVTDAGAIADSSEKGVDAPDFDQIEAVAEVELRLLELREGTGHIDRETLSARRRELEAIVQRCRRARAERDASPSSTSEHADRARLIVSSSRRANDVPDTTPRPPLTSVAVAEADLAAGDARIPALIAPVSLRIRVAAFGVMAIVVLAMLVTRDSLAPPSTGASVGAPSAPHVAPSSEEMPPAASATTGALDGPLSDARPPAVEVEPERSAQPKRSPDSLVENPQSQARVATPALSTPAAGAPASVSAPPPAAATPPSPVVLDETVPPATDRRVNDIPTAPESPVASPPASPLSTPTAQVASPAAPAAPRLPTPDPIEAPASAVTRPAEAAGSASPSAGVDPRSSIRQVMATYWRAFQNLDDSGVARAHPNVNVDVIRRSFSSMRSQRIDVLDEQLLIAGDSAVVHASVRHTYVPKAGASRSESYRATFDLRRVGSEWVIVSRR